MTRVSVLLLIVLAAAPTAGAQQARSLAAAGTLTCTTGERPAQATADAALSCRFQPLAGAEGSLTGYIARMGAADLPPGKRVLVWSVLAARTDVDAKALAGRYVGETGGQTTGQLVGGRDNGIVLQPVTVTSQAGEQPVPSVLELRLEAVRA